MRVNEWAKKNGFTSQTVWKWIREDKLPENLTVTTTPTGRYIIHDSNDIDESQNNDEKNSQCVCYARVSSSDQKNDLQRQADRLKAFALSMGFENPKVISEVGSGMNGKRSKLNSILSDPSYATVIVEHRDRLARINSELIESSLNASNRKLIVIDDSEMDDDLVSDVISVMTSFCARLYGRRSARHRAEKALEAASNG